MRQVTSLSINIVDSVKMLTPTKFQVAEQPERDRKSGAGRNPNDWIFWGNTGISA